MTGIKKPGIIVQCAVRQIDDVILNQMRNVVECSCMYVWVRARSRVYVGTRKREGFSALSCQLTSFDADKKPLRHRDVAISRDKVYTCAISREQNAKVPDTRGKMFHYSRADGDWSDLIADRSGKIRVSQRAAQRGGAQTPVRIAEIPLNGLRCNDHIGNVDFIHRYVKTYTRFAMS